MATHETEKDRIERILLRHPFLYTNDGDRGFCGGPYCASGVIRREEHATHVAEMLLSNPPEQTGATDE